MTTSYEIVTTRNSIDMAMSFPVTSVKRSIARMIG
jgi:hypothetical protein